MVIKLVAFTTKDKAGEAKRKEEAKEARQTFTRTFAFGSQVVQFVVRLKALIGLFVYKYGPVVEYFEDTVFGERIKFLRLLEMSESLLVIVAYGEGLSLLNLLLDKGA